MGYETARTSAHEYDNYRDDIVPRIRRADRIWPASDEADFQTALRTRDQANAMLDQIL